MVKRYNQFILENINPEISIENVRYLFIIFCSQDYNANSLSILET